MTPEIDPAVIRMLADDALETGGKSHSAAALMLVEAAASIIVTYHGRAGATEIAAMFAEYLTSTVKGALDFREGQSDG